MYNFQLKIPTEIYFGVNAEAKAGKLMKKYADRVLLVYGSERIFKAGLGSEIVRNLEEAGCSVVLCGGVKPNAEEEYINRAINIARTEGIQGIIAVGGGSVIDSAKAISASMYVEGSVKDVYNGKIIPKRFLPVGAIVTVPATASESNGMSVISNSDTNEKIAWFNEGIKPKFALLNPELTLTVGPYQTAVGGFDIFSHGFERYFDMTRNSKVFDALTEGLMKTVIDLMSNLIGNMTDINIRSEMMIAANIAHNDMIGPGGDFACHQMSHIITESYGVPHGGALAMIIPAWCEYMSCRNTERFCQFFNRVWGVETKGKSKAEVISEGINKIKSFINSIGLPLQIHTDCNEIDYLAQKAVEPNGFIGGGFDRMTKEDVIHVYEKVIITVA